MRFRDMKGRYVMHCHNVLHEDHAMMIRFDLT
jgi:FtsP/CotA-like multicopper oxidase with cupredoxin domain